MFQTVKNYIEKTKDVNIDIFIHAFVKKIVIHQKHLYLIENAFECKIKYIHNPYIFIEYSRIGDDKIINLDELLLYLLQNEIDIKKEEKLIHNNYCYNNINIYRNND